MQIEDYEPTAAAIDDTPRPKASQLYAAQQRARASDDAPTLSTPRMTRQQLIMAIVGVCSIVGVLTLALAPYRAPTPLAITPLATAQAFAPAAQASPAPTSAPFPTSAVDLSSAPAAPLSAAPIEEAALPQTGRGLTIDEAAPTLEPPAPSYVDQVGEQAPHCIRTCGDGSWAAPVPTAEPAMLEVIGQQAPHKVR